MFWLKQLNRNTLFLQQSCCSTPSRLSLGNLPRKSSSEDGNFSTLFLSLKSSSSSWCSEGVWTSMSVVGNLSFNQLLLATNITYEPFLNDFLVMTFKFWWFLNQLNQFRYKSTVWWLSRCTGDWSLIMWVKKLILRFIKYSVLHGSPSFSCHIHSILQIFFVPLLNTTFIILPDYNYVQQYLSVMIFDGFNNPLVIDCKTEVTPWGKTAILNLHFPLSCETFDGWLAWNTSG